ncbi:integral membrane ion antiporter [Mycobacterium europaeum]|uniref:Integral membrane ion antiporter n=1 Tax=Mycobacterium europaeum TaxID=761804 RepID=A0A0U1DD36_9MYCO|nr:cation:proton antiporter [Mycobacterium europaeum]CQD13143.1 integral membrane ion antiporter [Mycobacterium europaeum]
MNLAATFLPNTQIAPHQIQVFLLQIGLLLLLATVLGRLAVKLNLSAVVGELLAGVVLGPSILGHAAPGIQHWLFPAQTEQAHLLDVVGQVGVLLLVGITGAHLDLKSLRRRGATAVKVSLAGLLVPLALGIGVAFLLPATMMAGSTTRPTFAMFFGVAMCVSAIPVIAKTLADLNLTHRDTGQLILTAGMVDDAVGWFLLSVVSAMAVGGVHGWKVTLSVGLLIAFVVLAALAGRPLVRRAFRLAGRSSDSGASVVTAVLVIIAGASITQSLGLEAVFGAFVAGVLVGAPGAGEPARLASLRTSVMWVFAPIFLATAGLRMDLTALANPSVASAAVVVLAIAIIGKFAGAYIGARSSRLTRREGLALGAGMNARGVVEVVVALVGLRLGVISSATYTAIVLVAIITSLMAPPLLRRAMAGVDANAEERLREAAQSKWLEPAKQAQGKD